MSKRKDPLPAWYRALTMEGWVSVFLAVGRGLDRWWFGYGSPVTMGVFRLVMGFWIFVNQLMIGIDFEEWFTEKGFVPVAINNFYLGPEPRLNLLAGVADDRLSLLFFIAVTVAAFTTMIGLWTRVSSIVLALGIITLHHRNAIILHGGDLVVKMGAIYIALAPSGAACSVDRLIHLWRDQAPAVPAEVSLWPQRLIQFQVALVYFTTVWIKWFGSYWREGTATYFPLKLNEFDRFPLPKFMEEGFIVPITTYGTLAVELSLATLVFFKPWRKWAILGGVGLHLFIEYAMNIPLFAFCMITTYLAFFEGHEVSDWAKRVGQRFKRFALRVRLPRGQALRSGPDAAIQAMDPFDWVSYEAGDDETWTAVNAAGKPRPAFRSSLQRSVGGWPLALIPGAWKRLLHRALAPAETPSALKEEAKV